MTPASESFVALTMIMNRMVVSFGFSVSATAEASLFHAANDTLPDRQRPEAFFRFSFAAHLQPDPPAARSVVDRLVRQGPEIPDDLRRERRFPHPLGHQHADQILLRVDIPGC